MTYRQDGRKLLKALQKVKASQWQYNAAGVLLAANGLQSALKFVYGLEPRGLLPWQQESRYEQLSLLERKSDDQLG